MLEIINGACLGLMSGLWIPPGLRSCLACSPCCLPLKEEGRTQSRVLIYIRYTKGGKEKTVFGPWSTLAAASEMVKSLHLSVPRLSSLENGDVTRVCRRLRGLRYTWSTGGKAWHLIGPGASLTHPLTSTNIQPHALVMRQQAPQPCHQQLPHSDFTSPMN